MRRFFTSLLRLLAPPGFMLLSACATPPTIPASPDNAAWQAHRQALLALDNWQARGRIAVRAGEQGWSAGFDWRQAGGDYRIRLRGPFGQGALELEGDATGVWLTRPGQPAVFTTDPESLLEQETGWRLPVAGMDHWLRGLPDDGDDAVLQLDVDGRLAILDQRGWRIRYQAYRDVGGYALPKRLVLQRDGLRIKVLVDSWELP